MLGQGRRRWHSVEQTSGVDSQMSSHSQTQRIPRKRNREGIKQSHRRFNAVTRTINVFTFTVMARCTTSYRITWKMCLHYSDAVPAVFIAGHDGSLVSTGACNLEVHTRFESRSGRIFVAVHGCACICSAPNGSKAWSVQCCIMVLCTMKNTLNHSK